MIITNLKGGMGNQMFQYALGRKLAIKNNAELKLDISGYPKQSLRSYKLGVFNIQAQIATDNEIQKLKYPLGLLSKAWRRFSFKILRQHHVGWEPAVLNRTGDFYLDGFWQSYKYFDDIADAIRQDFTLREPLEHKYPEIVSNLKAAPSTSLHIRRTDYVTHKKTNQSFGALSLDYYHQALDKIAQTNPNTTVYVFTDDPAWVKDNLKISNPVVFAADLGLEDYEEMILMSLCNNHIIANSSFSWWGAWLDPRPDKIVIAPEQWFADGSIKIEDIIPQSWRQI